MSSKGLKLRFKGDVVEKKKKKKGSKRKGGGENDGEDGEGIEARPPNGNEQAWVPVERITDLSGPTLFFQKFKRSDDDGGSNDSGRYYCLALNPALNRVEAHPLVIPNMNDRGAEAKAAALDLDGAEVVYDEEDAVNEVVPTDVNQVWVSTRVLDTPSNAPRYTLRSSESRFITSEKSGAVNAMAEARGPLEEWSLVEGSGVGGRKYCLKSANDTLLGLDEMAGGKIVVRSEFEVKGGEQQMMPGTLEQWHIRVQWKFRDQARKKEQGEKPLRERDSSFKRIKT